MTFLAGLALKLFAGGVQVPVVTLPKVGVVLMVIGGVLAVVGLFQAARGAGVPGN